MSDKPKLSYSQLSMLMECPAAWWHKYIAGDYDTPQTEVMLIGQYTELLILEPEKAAAWLDDHEEQVWGSGGRWYKQTPGQEKEPKKGFLHAPVMAHAVKRHPAVAELIEGERQTHLELEYDNYIIHGYTDVKAWDSSSISDIKTTAKLEPKWNDTVRAKLPWYERYWLQQGLYGHIMQENGALPDAHIICVTRQDPPDVGIVHLDRRNLQQWANHAGWLIAHLVHWRKVYAEEEPEFCCHRCEWCRGNKIISEPQTVHTSVAPYSLSPGPLGTDASVWELELDQIQPEMAQEGA